MKKSALLSLLTTAAIITTTAGTFAAWDSLTANTSSGSITFTNPVTITSGENFTLKETSRILEDYPVASGNVSFTVKNDNDLVDTLTIVPSISSTNGANIKDFDIKIKNTVTKEDLGGNQNDGFTASATSSVKNYTVEVKPKNDNAVGKDITLSLTATLSKSSKSSESTPTPPQAEEGTY